MATQTILHEGLLAHDQQSTYVHLPFDMPAEATRLEVTYHYSDQISSDPFASGGNTIDLGVFDERGIKFLKAGFRGWSGSERSEFYITETEATPGYLAEALNPGRWNIMLGLYKIAPQGCKFQVKITIKTKPGHRPTIIPQRNTEDLPAKTPEVRASPWLRGELHCHTQHSDGALSAAGLVALARSRGMQFLAVTDHNTTACQRELERFDQPGIILIRGLEVTTFRGHFNVWGVPEWVDFRIQSPTDMDAALQRANQASAVTSCNHPKLFGPPWDYPDIDNFQCVEVWNGPWSGLDETALEFWISLLETGRRIPAVGGSDFHRQSEGERNIGTPTNWIYVPVEPTAANLLMAIRRGHVSLSDEPEGPFLDFRCGEEDAIMGGDILKETTGHPDIRITCRRGTGCRLSLLDQRGVLLELDIRQADETIQWSLPTRVAKYIRAELRANTGRLRALTNPIYLP